MDLGLDGRVYIVSGASQGLGFATAAVLAAEGARLVLCSRDVHRVRAAADRLDAGDRVAFLGADLAVADTADRLVAMASERFGRVDGAVISVGGPPPGATAAIDDDAWRSAFDSVFLGPLRLARTVLAAAEARRDGGVGGGAGGVGGGVGGEAAGVTFVLSTSVRTPIAGLAVSNGLRPGLAMAAKTLADEHGPRGSRVNVVLPGRIDTARIRQLEEASGDADAARQAAVDAIPLGRIGTPEEFGRVAAFVTSPAASYVSGSVITVDGGATRSL